MQQHDDDWAVFWCSLLGEILLDEVPAGERRRYLRELSQKVVTLPNGKRKRISLSTLRRRVRQFRKLRIAGLKRKPRTDRGGIRKDRRAMLKWVADNSKDLERTYGRIAKASVTAILRRLLMLEEAGGDVLLVQGSREAIAQLKESGSMLVLDGTTDLPRTHHARRALLIMALVVLAAAGYPGAPRKGDVITGIDDALAMPGVRSDPVSTGASGLETSKERR